MFAASKSGSADAKDAQFKNVTMLLHGNGTNGAQNNTFVDSSTNNFTITRNGNTTQGTFTPYGSNWSNYFDGSSNLALSSAPVPATGAFTVECWVYITGTAASQSVYSQYASGDANRWMILWNDTANKFTFAVSASTSYNSTNTYSANTWYHIAWVRDGSNNLSFYVNGVRDSTNAGVTTSLATVNPMIGNRGGGGTPYTGYVSNLRITNTAVYSGTTYTVSTTPLTNISGTTLLTCQSNRFVDNETTAKTFTITGSPSVQRFSPFSPTTAYSTSVIGGSGYFDGSGDYLQTSSTQIIPASTTYTIEAWVYLTGSYADYRDIVCQGTSGNANRVILYINITTGELKLQIGSNGYSTGVTIVPNQWYYLAVRNNAGTYNIYVNGVSVATGTDTTTPQNTSLTIGAFSSGAEYFPGYISDVRISSTARTISLPTAPFTSDANTRLLANFTNAGILDNAMMNDLETVGNAQLSTSVKKYGSGSISMTSSGDYLKGTQPSVVYDINGGDFTIEFWVNFTSLAADRALVSKYGNTAENAGGLGYVVQWVQSSSVLRLVLGVGGGSDALYTWSWSPSTSTWYHVAITRSGTSGRAFVNGTQIGTTSTLSTSDVASPNVIQLGKTHTVAQYLLGYMDDVRITKGVARYTANFTAPTAAFPDKG